jgi:hypothetical protein
VADPRRAGLSAVFDGIGAVRAIERMFITNWELTPWQTIIMMQLSFIVMGMFLDDTAMLVIVAPLYVPLVAAAGPRDRGADDLVRHPLHDDLPDRLYHAALRL